jgi:hypothetical protein
LAGCGQKQDVVIWDAEHKPVFPPKSFSRFISSMESSGLVVIEGSPDDLEGVKGVEGYIIAGPTTSFEADEISRIEEFVKAGGKLVVMVHIPPSNLKPLLDTFGIEISLEPLKGRDVKAMPAYSHILTEEIDEILLFGCFKVSNPIFTVKSQAGMGFQNGEAGGAEGVVGVVGFRKYGEGEILVIGDDTLFMDDYINSGDNLKFAQNIAKWLGLRSV